MKSSHLKILKAFLAELVGTALLLFFSCLGCIDSERSFVIKCLISGLTVMVVIATFGDISGAHINPVLTVASVIYKTISWQVMRTSHRRQIRVD